MIVAQVASRNHAGTGDCQSYVFERSGNADGLADRR